MKSLAEIGAQIAAARKGQGLGAMALAEKAGVTRTTLYLLESGRATEIGYSKLARLLAVLGLELRVEPLAQQRPTLEDLMKEDSGDA